MVMAAFDWIIQLIANTVSWLGSVELVAGLPLLYVLLAFVIMGVVISNLTPKT